MGYSIAKRKLFSFKSQFSFGNWYTKPKETTHSFLEQPYFWRLGIPYFLQNGKLLLAFGIHVKKDFKLVITNVSLKYYIPKSRPPKHKGKPINRMTNALTRKDFPKSLISFIK